MIALGWAFIVAGVTLMEVGMAGLLGWAERDRGLFLTAVLIEIGITTILVLLIVGITLVDA